MEVDKLNRINKPSIGEQSQGDAIKKSFIKML